MAKATTAISKDFFTSASKMSLGQFETFLRDVVLNTHPKDFMPVIVWGPAGVGKSSIIEQVFGKTEAGLQTVILSQIGPLDTNGLPHIENVTIEDKFVKENTHKTTEDETVFTPNRTFGRGRKHLFLDELNNAAPSTLAAVQNLLSSKQMGGDSYEDVHIICACNPPSTNSLAMDINFPTVSRVMHIILEYTLDDFINYALATGYIHPAVTAFHKKSNGTFLQAKWSCSNANYSVPEPGANEPFPCPRSWTLASNAMKALSKNKSNGKVVDYSMLKPLIEGCVGIKAADEFATTYAFMNKIPDIEKIYSGEMTAENTALGNEIAVQYLTTMSLVNYCIGAINQGVVDKITARIDNEKSPAYKLLAGIHRSIRFLGTVPGGSVELANLAFVNVFKTLRQSFNSNEFVNKLVSGVDPKKGLTRQDLIQYSRTFANTQSSIEDSINHVEEEKEKEKKTK